MVSMNERKPTQLCAICGAHQPLSAHRCAICGATLPGQPTPVASIPAVPSPDLEEASPRPRFDPAQGDDDLYAGELTGRIRLGLAVLGVVAILIVGAAVVLALNRSGDGTEVPDVRATSLEDVPTAPPTATPRNGEAVAAATEGEGGASPQTPTRRPGTVFPTVTPAPPTPTITPTQGPCMQTAQTGDTLYAMASRCGHRDLAIVDAILQLNDMRSPEELQIGQELEIPWPTPTPGPGGESGEGGVGGAATGADGEAPPEEYNAFGTPSSLATYANVEPTLRPGLAWHTVQSGENILIIAQDYDTDLETLSQLNPEVPFLQCDYGSPTGGDLCRVIIVPGQQVRVPVPIPSASPTPSPVGTLTPTPTPTATFNAPYLVSPEDGAHFNADQMVTVRWGGTGALGQDERYVLRVKDRESGAEHVAALSETAYILPGGWQPTDRRRHTFEWTISVGTVDAQNRIISESHAAGPRTFTWDSR